MPTPARTTRTRAQSPTGAPVPAAPVRIEARRAAPAPSFGPGVLITDRLVLRPLAAPDRDAFCTALVDSREHLRRWFPTTEPAESAADYFARQLAAAAATEADGSARRRAVFTHTGQFVGVVNILHIERGMEWTGDINWWVAADQTRRGYAREMVSAAADHALADLPDGLGLVRLFAAVHPENEPSRRLAAALGFTPDPARASKLLVDSVWQTHDFFVRTAF